MANLSDIVNVNIDISTPAVDSASFDNLLIVGPPPAAVDSSDALPKVGVYSVLEEVEDAGYITIGEDADPIGIAARIAFSQEVSPAQIYIAPQMEATPLITAGDIKIITKTNALTEAIPIGTIDGAVTSDLPWVQVTYSREAVMSMEAEIIKDGVSRFGKSLPTEEDASAFLQVAIGTTSVPNGDQMGVTSGEEDGNYKVILTAGRGQKTTTLEMEIAFDGTNYTAGAITSTTTPNIQLPVETLSEAIGTEGWYVVCAAGIPESGLGEIAEWTEAHEKLFCYTFLSKTDPVSATYYRTFSVCGLIHDNDNPGDVPVDNSYLHVGMAARFLAYPSGSEMWENKTLAALEPSEIGSTLRKSLEDGSSSYFARYVGRNIIRGGKVRAGEWIDVIRGRDWLKNDMKLRIFNLMLENPKVPYTNNGIALAQNEMIASLKSARSRGIVAPDEYDQDGKLIAGFTTSVPNALSLTAAQRASRLLRGCKFRARLAGAIRTVELNGSLGA